MKNVCPQLFCKLLALSFIQFCFTILHLYYLNAESALNIFDLILYSCSSGCLIFSIFYFNIHRRTTFNNYNNLPFKDVFAKSRTIAKYGINYIFLGVSLIIFLRLSSALQQPVYLYLISGNGILFLLYKYIAPHSIIGRYVIFPILISAFIVVPSVVLFQNNLTTSQCNITLLYGLFFCIMGLVLLLLHDMLKINIHHQKNINTIPIIIGRHRTLKICICLLIFLLLISMAVCAKIFLSVLDFTPLLKSLLLINLLLVFGILYTKSAKSNKNYYSILYLLYLESVVALLPLLILNITLNAS